MHIFLLFNFHIFMVQQRRLGMGWVYVSVMLDFVFFVVSQRMIEVGNKFYGSFSRIVNYS